MAPLVNQPSPPDYRLFGLQIDDGDDDTFPELVHEAIPADGGSEVESFGFIELPLFPGDLDDVPELTMSPTTSEESNPGPFDFGPLVDIEYFDSVIENTENSLVLMRNLAVIPQYGPNKQKHIAKMDIDFGSDTWNHLKEATRTNIFYLLTKLMSRIKRNQLEAFQLDEFNAHGEIFPVLQKQVGSLRHLSLHETSLIHYLAEGRVPRHLQSLVIHGINIKVGATYLAFLLHIGRHYKTLNYLSLNFRNLYFPNAVDWVDLERYFSNMPTLDNLRSLTVSNCQDMMALQFGTLTLIPWSRLRRLKIVNCPTLEAGGCPGLTNRLRVTHLTHLNLTRTCSPEDAAQLISGLVAGLQRLHLEFSYEQGHMSTDCLMGTHSHTLRYLWMEASTGKQFRLVESATGKEPSLSEFARFKRLRELAIAIRYAAIEKYTIEWENPPNLHVFRILNIVERYVHKTKGKERCICKIAEDFARIHVDELADFHPRDLEVIVIGRYIEDAPEVEPIYYWTNVSDSDSDSDSSSTSSNPDQGMTFGGSPFAGHFLSRRRRQRRDKSHLPDGIPQQPVEYDAGDEAEKGEAPPSPGPAGLPEQLSNLKISEVDGDDEDNPAFGTPGLPDDDQRCCVLTNIDEVKQKVREITIIDVDREGAAFWEQDEMIIHEYYPNLSYR
ncbi:hypothetical protein TWF481_008751 [Arthrobotrys musiformis]|uniref:F-box domain-containing protein n=1 Tax=Arthrobotrys musiformis TaxID=47236 RepID=A0AAV9W9Z7_9PEZI